MTDPVVPSLMIEVEKRGDRWVAAAPWLEEPVEGDSWYEVWVAALRARHTGSRGKAEEA